MGRACRNWTTVCLTDLGGEVGKRLCQGIGVPGSRGMGTYGREECGDELLAAKEQKNAKDDREEAARESDEWTRMKRKPVRLSTIMLDCIILALKAKKTVARQ